MKLHLVNDEKIINRTIDTFEEVFPGENLFVVTNKSTSSKFKWVRTGKNVLARKDFVKHKDEFCFTEVYIHLLNVRKMSIVESLSLNNAKVYWIIWGMDLYNKLLSPMGYEMFDEISSKFYNTWQRKLLNPLIRVIKKHKVSKTIRFIEKKVDYIVTDTTENDYQYLIKYFPQLAAKPWRDFFYYPIDVVLGKDMMAQTINGNNIIIGNSASMTNNHCWVMDILSKYELHNRKVYMPLSYSQNKAYVNYVVEKGNRLFEEHFNPLLSFMPLEQYNMLQQSINVALYGNWRQEAIGNILVSLYLGAKVFLAKRNPVYEWALNHHLIVYPLESLSQQDLDSNLSAEEKQHNKEVLLQLYTKERLHQLIKAL